MALCYQKEAFISGLVITYFLFVIIGFFEDVINKWPEKVKKKLLKIEYKII